MDLSHDLLEYALAACRTNSGEVAAALGRALDGSFAIAIGSPTAFPASGMPAEFQGAGLAAVLSVGATAALLAVPAVGGIVPAWCAQPDATGQSKLATLGQELGMLLLPESVSVTDYKVAAVRSLAGAIKRGGVAEGADVIPLRLKDSADSPVAWLIWPAPNPAMVLGAGMSGTTAPGKPAAPAASAAAARPATAAPRSAARVARPEQLPGYSRSLLKIQVPVRVVLAEQRQPLRRIIELGPGSIIQFEKSCEEMLELEAGRCRIASGEAVKVGDKFGLRITSIVLPEERFSAVGPTAAAKA